MTDVVKGTLQPKTLVYEWKIERFFADCKSVGDSYTSPSFFAHHPDKITKWYIRIYPKGLNEDKKNYISIWLNFDVVDNRELTVNFKFSKVNGQNIFSTTEKVASSFKGPSLGCGMRLEQCIIKDIGDLTDDTLTIMCEIRYDIQADQVVEEKWSGQHLTTIGKGLDDYEELFEKASFSDVTFNIQERKIHLHKAILSHRSPFFKAMFENDMKEKKQSSIDITNFDYPVMKELFRFIYAERVKEIDKIAKDLLVAADYYSIVELKDCCENVLYNELEVHNAVEYLNLTDMYDSIRLKTLVIDFTAKHYKEIIEKPGFADLNSKIMYQIMQAIAENNN